VVIHFHGTPGSRLDLSFGEHIAGEQGVRLVTFDRPGYGGSTAAPFGLASIAADAHAVADGLGVARFATLGMSGGGPGALAAATVPGDRVIRAGVASGAAPFQLVPGALDHLDDNDRAAIKALPADPAAAAAGFGAGFEPLIDAVAHGGRRYRDGHLERTRLGADHARIPLPDLPARDALAVPTGELEAAHRASGAGAVLAYSGEVPSGRTTRALLPAVSALLAVRPIRAGLQRLVSRMRLRPPVKSGEVSWAYARLDWPGGTHREAWLRTGEGYGFTAKVAAHTAARISNGAAEAGAFTPGALFGTDLARDAGAEIITPDGVAR